MKKNNNKLIITIIALSITIVVIVGATFAYWQWAGGTTNVSVTVEDGIQMEITPSTTKTTVLYPVSRNNCEKAMISGTAKVKITNNTGVLARPKFYLKIQIFDPKNGDRNITVDSVGIPNNTDPQDKKTKYAHFINYAVAPASSSETCVTAARSGHFTDSVTTIPNQQGGANTTTVAGWYNSDIITELNGTFPVLTTTDPKSMSFNANAGQVTEYEYKFWIWIDSSYAFQNTGNSVTDPLQDAEIKVSWSETSEVIQVR
jgi:hypothetical protein